MRKQVIQPMLKLPEVPNPPCERLPGCSRYHICKARQEACEAFRQYVLHGVFDLEDIGAHLKPESDRGHGNIRID